MTLRVWVALITTAVVLPVLMLSALGGLYLGHRTFDEVTATAVVTMMQSGERWRCEAQPQSWTPEVRVGLDPRRRGPPNLPFPPPGDLPALAGRRSQQSQLPPFERLELFPYDASGASPNPRAPELGSLTDPPLDAAEARVLATALEGHRDLLVAMPWTDGPCALIVARRQAPSMGFWFAGSSRSSLLPAGAALLGVLIAVTPLVRRIRKLTATVSEVAASGYRLRIDPRGTDELSSLARAFDAAGREIREHLATQELRERTLREFVENTTHDTMIPLTVLQGHLTELRDMIASAKLPVVSVEGAMREAHYLASLLRNLSIAAKLEGSVAQEPSAPVQLHAVIERAVLRHLHLARASRVELQSAVPEQGVYVLGDLTLIEQLLSNLIQNAVRHNRAGGHVAVTLTATEATFKLDVIDDGPGIPDEELALIPERYFRGNLARTRVPGGQGVGLSIAFKIAERHRFALVLRRSEYGGLQAELQGPLAPTHDRGPA